MVLSSKQLQIINKIISEHPQHPGIKELSSKQLQLQLIKKVNSEQPKHPVLMVVYTKQLQLIEKVRSERT